MSTETNGIPPALQEIIADFQWAEGREKLELLIQYAETLPDLPEHLEHDESLLESVPECMTPVHIHAETQDGRMAFYFIVPQESPTVRGFASLMAQGLNGAAPEQVLGVPNDFFRQMGLEQVLTQQRLNGISAILAHMKRLALAALSA